VWWIDGFAALSPSYEMPHVDQSSLGRARRASRNSPPATRRQRDKDGMTNLSAKALGGLLGLLIVMAALLFIPAWTLD
jgi:hypothetical protein